MPLLNEDAISRAQVALEFIVIYSFVLVVFVLMFALVSGQRAATLAQQEYSMLQLQAQNVAGYIDQALGAGNGYAATITFSGGINGQPYNMSISTSGVIIAQMKVGTQIIRGYAFSNARNLVINGTQTQSGNGITVYQIPIQRGSLYLANSNGAIYVDTPPPSTLPLAKSMTLASIANTRVASFNGVSSYINAGSDPITGSSPFTLSAWINTNQLTQYSGALAIGNYLSSQSAYIGTVAAAQVGTSNSIGGGFYGTNLGTSITALNTWEYVVLTYAGGAGGAVHVYVNGTDKTDSTFTASITPGNTVIGNIGSPYWFKGMISNAQLYSVALTSSQVWQLYQEGMNGAPLPSVGMIGWWPLNGNPNDYSGQNNNGAPVNVVYQSAAQINTQVTTGSGAAAVNTLVGFVTSNGILGPSGNSIALYTNATGSDSFFVSSNGLKEIANLTINSFNDNITTVGNLVGWWPLDEGYGNTVYDLSEKYNNGAFVNPAWVPFTTQTNLAAAKFNYPTATGYITTNDADLPLSNSQRSIFAWVNWAGNVDSYNAYIVDLYGTSSSSPYAQSELIVAGGTSPYVEFVSAEGCALTTPSITSNVWHFIGYTYNGGTSMTVYLDGFSRTCTLAVPLNTISSGAQTIGGPWDYWYGAPYAGSISNVQIYNIVLTPSQISQLYKEGISGVPISDAGLSGWWSLAYNANDFSNNNNNGALTNVAFGNVNYTNPITSGAPKVAQFNGVNTVINTADNLPSSVLTVSFWFKLTIPYNSQPNSYPGFMGKSSSFSIEVDKPTGLMHFYNWNGGVYTSNRAITDTNWHYFALTINGISQSMYLDGVQTAANSNGAATVSNSNPLMIGEGWSGPVAADMADVQIYNTALTAAQIQQAYQQGMPLYGKMNVSLG
jgi:hypothetical protein